MIPAGYCRAASVDRALLEGAQDGAAYLGGGTNLVDLMREGIASPSRLVDVSRLSASIRGTEDGGVRIGAAATNADVAADPLVRERHPLLSEAILNGASGQIRNMATAAGNLLQRTRCLYFYESTARCNKRLPASGCDALEGMNRMHAILGASPQCVATHPSDMSVALAVLDATVHAQGAAGTRVIPIGELHRLPGDVPAVDTTLQPGELITAIELPPPISDVRSAYRKVRDRASYAFALVSVAALLKVREGRVVQARVGLGGVAHRPWRDLQAERSLVGAPPDSESFEAFADALLNEARPLRDNGFKVDLARRLMVRTLEELATPEAHA